MSTQFSRNRQPQADILPGLNGEETAEEDVWKELESRLEGDLDFGSGRILGSMCSKPDSFAAEVFISQLEKNLGDPGLHPALARMEKETVDIIASMLNGEPGKSAGAVLSGGTEANILALWTAKLQDSGKRRTVVLPESAHFSFDKAASLMDLRLKKIPVDRRHRFSLSAFEDEVDENTLAIVGIAGTTGLGMVDPIPELAQIARQKSIYLHVDAAFGGFVLPFLEEAGYSSAPFDFTVPGVCSITIDPHKMGRAPIPAGCIVYRNEEIAGISQTRVGYLSGGETAHQTIVGTRSGAATASVWATLRRYGRRGFVETVRRSMEVTAHLTELVRSTPGMSLVTEPFMNVVGIELTDNNMSARELADILRKKGYALSLFPGYLRISVMPHIGKKTIDHFWKEVKNALS